MRHGIQIKLAKVACVSSAYIHELLSGKKHASFLTAKRLGEITGSDPMIWLNGGGTPEERQAAVEAWAAKDALQTPALSGTPFQKGADRCKTRRGLLQGLIGILMGLRFNGK